MVIIMESTMASELSPVFRLKTNRTCSCPTDPIQRMT